MSDYLTPRQLMTYKTLLALLSIRGNTTEDILSKQDNYEILAEVAGAIWLKHANKAVQSTRDHLILCLHERILRAEKYNKEKGFEETSPGLERPLSPLEEAAQVIRNHITLRGAHDSLYQMMMDIYSHPKIKTMIDNGNGWMLNEQFKQALDKFHRDNSAEVISFLYKHDNEFAKGEKK